MHDRFHRIIISAPSVGGMGMSTRPAFYGGRGVNHDVNSDKLVAMYKGLQHPDFPPTAASDFVKLVLAIPRMTGSDLVASLSSFEAAGFTFSPEQASDDPFQVDRASEVNMVASMFARMGSDQDEWTALARTNGIKFDFCRAIGVAWRPEPLPPRMSNDGTRGCAYEYPR